MVSNNTFIFIFTRLRRDRCACCLDVDVKRDNGNDFFFCFLGPGRVSRSPAHCDYDRSGPGANRRARGCVPTKQNLFVLMARAARDAIASRNT